MTDTLSDPVSVARMTAHYDGAALRNHEIDVRLLSPALMGLSIAFERTQYHVAPSRQIKLNAKATREGSVDIDLIVRVINAGMDLLASRETTAALNATAIGIYVFGAISLIKKAMLHGGKPTKIEGAESDDAKTDVKYPDGTIERTYPESLEMIGDAAFVQGVKDSTAPALHDGIDLVEFHLPNVSESVTTEEAENINDFDVSDNDVSTSSVEMVVQAINPSFQADGKWRVTDGIKKQYVALEDHAFEKRVVDSLESLKANDTYKVIMRVEKKLDSKNQLTTRYIAIEKVLDHRHIEEQGALF
ncbi:MAG: hypothetical protein LKI88_00615 [Bifidobacterium sp.]|nr:hypothetical protein [Bifidobacterium sp.]MCI1864432.1 hypothetical protein [Bifidobacterium sp.]